MKVDNSLIPNAGLGLFLLESAKAGECIARYSGEALTKEECARRGGHYRLKIHSNLFLDAEDKSHFEGRYINDGARTGIRPNARFAANYVTNKCTTTGFQWVRIFATRPIAAGEEIYLDYGESFWSHTDTTPTKTPAVTAATPPPDENATIWAAAANIPSLDEESQWAAPAMIPTTPEPVIYGHHLDIPMNPPILPTPPSPPFILMSPIAFNPDSPSFTLSVPLEQTFFEYPQT